MWFPAQSLSALWRARLNAKLLAGVAITMTNKHYTYVLSCSDTINNRSVYYVGMTTDLDHRLKTHQSGGVRSTKSFDKIKLVYYEVCFNKSDARCRELQLKTGFGRGYIKRRLENYLHADVV